MKRAGHTLAETLVVLALAILLFALAVPALHELLARLQLRAAVADLQAAIHLTRSQALGRGGIVLLVPSEAGGDTWQRGWLVFADANHNRRPDGGETIIFRHGPLPAGIVVSSHFSSATAPTYLAYNGAGRGCDAANGQVARWGTLSLRQGEQIRRIKIGMLGRPRICDPAVDGASCSGDADGDAP
ncbi:MAG: GspH/FimT family pseudopilin [Sphingomonadaceae bacterium]